MAASNGATNSQSPRPVILCLYATKSRAPALVELFRSHDSQVITSPLDAARPGWVAELEPDLLLLEPSADKRRLLKDCETVRGWTDRPVMVLSETKDEIAVARAFAAGIDEYLVLPVGARELSARIEAMLRRFGRRAAQPDVTRAGGLQLSSIDLSAECHGRKVALSPIEFRLLSCLLSAEGRVVTHEAIMLRVWGAEYVESRHYLHLYIRYLREKLEADPAHPGMILSEWGVGYRLVPPEPAVE